MSGERGGPAAEAPRCPQQFLQGAGAEGLGHRDRWVAGSRGSGLCPSPVPGLLPGGNTGCCPLGPTPLPRRGLPATPNPATPCGPVSSSAHTRDGLRRPQTLPQPHTNVSILYTFLYGKFHMHTEWAVWDREHVSSSPPTGHPGHACLVWHLPPHQEPFRDSDTRGRVSGDRWLWGPATARRASADTELILRPVDPPAQPSQVAPAVGAQTRPHSVQLPPCHLCPRPCLRLLDSTEAGRGFSRGSEAGGQSPGPRAPGSSREGPCLGASERVAVALALAMASRRLRSLEGARA